MTTPGGPIDIELNLDADGYIGQARAAAVATEGLAGAVVNLQRQQTLLQRAMTSLTPFRAAAGAFTGGTAAAAAQEQRLSQLAATQAVVGTSARRLTGDINALARSFPTGQRGAEQLFLSLQRVTGLGQGQERRITELATQFTKLSGATGESAEQVGADMVRLQRAFGNSTLDPKRIQAASDSLTLLSKTSGASAGGILQFSNAIAPLARSAGIGQGAVLGISTAFSKMGEDGFAAANTINKVLADISRSARDGSEELNTYADIAGKTREEFERMVQANPSGALQSVVENLAAPGERGQRNLERIGLDGVRQQRVLTQLSAQGGFQGEIDTALRGAGLKGATDRGAEAAFGGLNDAAEQAASAAEQLAIALGKPLLTPLEAFTRLIGGATGVAAKAVGATTGIPGTEVKIPGTDKPVPGISAGTILAAGGVLLALAKLGGIAGIAKLIGTSQIVRAPFAGLAAGRGATEGFAARFGAPVNAAFAAGTLGRQLDPNTGEVLKDRKGNDRTNMAGAIARPIREFFRGAGEGVGPAQRGTVSGATGQDIRSGAARAFSGAARYLSYASDAWSRVSRDANQQSLVNDPGRRRSSMTPDVGSRAEAYARQARIGFDGAGAALRQGNFTPFMNGLRGSVTALKQWDASIRTSQGSWANLRRTGSALYQVFSNLVKAGGSAALTLTRLGLAGVGAGARGAASLLGTVTGGAAGAVMLAGIGGYMRYSGLQKAREEEDARVKDMGLTSGLDAYRESLARAGESTMTLAEAMKASARGVSESTTTFKQALTVRAEDRQAARNTRDDVVMELGGSVAAIAAQIRAMGADRTPADLNAVKVDLLRQDYSTDFVNQVLEQVEAGRGRSLEQTMGADQVRDLAAGIATESDYERLNRMEGSRDITDSFMGMLGKSTSGLAQLGNALTPGQMFSPGGRFNNAEVSEQVGNAIDLSLQQIGGQREQRTQTYGEDFATQSFYREINDLYKAVAAEGDTNATAKLSEQISTLITGERRAVAPEEIGKGGIVGVLARTDEDLGKIYREEYDRGVRIAGEPGLAPTEQMGTIAEQAARVGGPMASFFDNRQDASRGRTNQLIAQSAEDQGHAGKFRDAVDAMVNSAVQAGESLEDVAATSYELSTTFEQTTQQFRIAQAARAEAQTRMQTQGAFQTSGQNLLRGLRGNLRVASTEGTTQYTDTERQQARQGVGQAVESVDAMLEQRLKAYQEYDIQLERQQTDFDLQRQHQTEDFERNVARIEFDYALQRARQQANFLRQEARQEEDFQRGRARTIEDYNRGRMRSLRNFNRQMARMIEDSAKSLLDPYQRLQSQPVWDTSSLVQNLGSQLEAVTDQVRNLGTLRRRGLSQAVIDMLGLSDPNRAQQLAQIVADTARDASLVGELNTQGTERLEATRSLVGDPANNRDVRRQVEDFARDRAQEAEDFARSLERQDEDYARSRRRAREDNARGRAEQAADHARQMLRQAQDQERMVRRQNAAFELGLDRMQADFERQFQEFNGGFLEMQEAVLTRMSGASVKYGDLMTADLAETIGEMTTLINDYRGIFQPLLPDIEQLPMPERPKGSSAAERARQQSLDAKRDRLEFGGPSDADEARDWSHPAPGGRPTSGFGPRRSPGGIGSTNHKGQDWALPIGSAVKAVLDGIVVSAGRAGGYGNMLELSHGGGRTTRYAHLSGFNVAPGDRVDAGEVVARSGNTGNSTGPHLHFETRQNGQAVSPLRTLSRWAGQPVPLDAGGEAAPQDITDPKLLRAIALLGLTPEQFIAGISGASGGSARPTSGSAAANEALGRRMAAAKGWRGSDLESLDKLWTKESGWNNLAQNPTSTAFGIPQFLNSTWATVGERKTTDPEGQIRAGLKYIGQRYGDPDAAWAHSQRLNWYAKGGVLSGAQVIGVGEAGPEAVIPLNEQGIDALAQAMQRFIGHAEAQMMVTGGARTHITYVSESHEYDQSVRVTGPITVQSEDPDTMARKLEAKTRRDNLTAGPRRSR